MRISRKMLQNESWNPKKHNNEKPLAYVATYNKNNPELFAEIIKDLEEINKNDKIKEILDTTKVIKSQSQPKNFKRILTSSTFGENSAQGVTKCKKEKCKIFDIIIEWKSYTFKKKNVNKIQNKDLCCNSKNVVYIIESNKCKKIYIGSTQTLSTRISIHKSNIKKKNRK